MQYSSTMRMEEQISRLEKVTGKNIDELTNLFMQGYTLEEPVIKSCDYNFNIYQFTLFERIQNAIKAFKVVTYRKNDILHTKGGGDKPVYKK